MSKTTIRRNYEIVMSVCDTLDCCGECTSRITLSYDHDGDLHICRGGVSVWFPRAVLPSVAEGFRILATEAEEEGL